MSNIIRSRKVTRIIPLNLEEVAQLQTRINEFLSDNANKDNTWPCAPSSPDAEKTSNLSSQVEKVPLLKESVPEAEGTAKMEWWWWWYYPTPSEGWGRRGTPRRPNSRATLQGLDHRSRVEREEPKIDLRRGSEAGQSRRR